MSKNSTKRKIEVVVVSDVHLGTYGCQAKALLNYLKSIQPGILILNGDIIDGWQFSKSYFPTSHMKVIKYLMGLMSKGTEIYYITGNHDEVLRRFAGFELGSFKLVNKLLLPLDGKMAWIFHGDVFDVVMKNSKWLAKLGGKGYDILILINTFVNWCSAKLGRGKISFSKKIKNSVKGAVKHINNFEETAAQIAIDNGYDYVVCGHIHHPQHRTINLNDGSVEYINSGDWIENLSALEYNDKTWNIYRYHEDPLMEDEDELTTELIKAEQKHEDIFKELMAELQLKQV